MIVDFRVQTVDVFGEENNIPTSGSVNKREKTKTNLWFVFDKWVANMRITYKINIKPINDLIVFVCSFADK